MRLEIANKKRFVLVVLVLVVLFVIVWVLVGAKPSSTPGVGKPSLTPGAEGLDSRSQRLVNPFASLKSPVALSYLGSEKTFPNDSETYQLSGQVLTAEEVKSLAARFGFSEEPIISEDKVQGKVYFWNNSEATFRWREKQQVLKYALKNIKAGKVSVPLSFDEGKIIAQTFLEKYGLWSGLSFQEGYQYLKNLETETSLTEASLSEGIKVSLTYTVGNLPLWDEFLGGDPVSVTVLNDGRVAFVSYLFFHPAELKNSSMVKLKSLVEARQDLSRGEGLAVSSLSKNPQSIEAIPSNGLTDQVRLVLFRSIETATAQPFFIFSGPSVQVLLPAAAQPYK